MTPRATDRALDRITETMDTDALLTEVDATLASAEVDEPRTAVLALLIDRFGVESGTIHLLGDEGLLELDTAMNIPPPVLSIIERIPIGKGMAGLAAERRAPVSMCNLQEDQSGDARPGARATGLKGTVAVPILAGDAAVGALGIGTQAERTFSEEEADLLIEVGRRIAAARG